VEGIAAQGRDIMRAMGKEFQLLRLKWHCNRQCKVVVWAVQNIWSIPIISKN